MMREFFFFKFHLFYPLFFVLLTPVLKIAFTIKLRFNNDFWGSTSTFFDPRSRSNNNRDLISRLFANYDDDYSVKPPTDGQAKGQDAA